MTELVRSQRHSKRAATASFNEWEFIYLDSTEENDKALIEALDTIMRYAEETHPFDTS